MYEIPRKTRYLQTKLCREEKLAITNYDLIVHCCLEPVRIFFIKYLKQFIHVFLDIPFLIYSYCRLLQWPYIRPRCESNCSTYGVVQGLFWENHYYILSHNNIYHDIHQQLHLSSYFLKIISLGYHGQDLSTKFGA